MHCDRCDLTMVEIDDCGDGSRGWECPGCGAFESDADQPCPADPDGDPCYGIDNEWGGIECAMCGRDM
jgi:hypothetical protein